MKIAIITLPLNTNYGGILQAYALQTVLQRMGHDVQHLQPKVEFHPLHPVWKMPFVWSKRLLGNVLGESGDYPYLNILIVGYVDTRMCLFTSI